MNEATPQHHARDLLDRGLAPIPVPPKSKAPTIAGWPTLRLAHDDLPRYFNGAPSNIGALIGEPSGWIIDVDLDHARAVELADTFLPDTGMTWGRASKPRSHRLYRVTRPVDTRKWASKSAGMIVELRSTGCQTIAPGSTHPSGEAVRYYDDGEPASIDPEVLIAAIEKLASSVRRELGDDPDTSGAPFPRPASPNPRGPSNYGREALRREAATVAATPNGARNDTLNRAAFNVGTLIGGGEVDRAHAAAELLTAARACGLPDAEAERTIASGIEAGIKQPRQRPTIGNGDPSASDSPECDDEATGDDRRKREPAQAEQVVRLALELFRLGQTPKREPFAVSLTGPNVVGLLGGSGGSLYDMIAREYRRRFGRVMTTAAFKDALATLRGEAIDAPTEAAHLRVGPFEQGVVLDLGSVDGSAVVVDATGWRIVDRSPILFQRTALTGELPTPARGGRLDSLRELLNVTDETWPILLGWIVAALIPDMPHPILMLGGTQGTGKTTAGRFICGLFDPSDAPTRSQPRDPEAWAMSVANGWSTLVDNVSSIPPWWSDALCMAVTGDGWVRRALYTNGDVAVLSFRRVIALTSIDAGALRGDLGERVVLVDLEPIDPAKRRTERKLEAAYRAVLPAILGAVLDLLAGVLARRGSINLPSLPRMADFACVLAAIDATIGTDSLALYADQGRRIAAEVLESDPVGEAVATFVRECGTWSGTAGELFLAIKPEDAGREWPKGARGLGARLKRLSPALELQGVRVTPPARNDHTRTYLLQTTAQTARPPENAAGAGGAAGDDRAVGEAELHDRPRNRPSGTDAGGPTQGASGRSGGSGGRADTTAEGDGWGEL
ncbi:MAG: bifunctional DNA primase/polymerase [Phycisphaerales bacterium]